MLTALNSAVSGLDAYQEQMDIIGNNIANINTAGFKTATGNLVDSFSDTLQAATAASGTSGGTDGMQLGTGVITSSITNDWSMAGTNTTNIVTNLAVTNGNGFFVVQDPASNAQYATQDGTFKLNNSGQLVTNSGMLVMGANTAGTPPTGFGPISIDTKGNTSTTTPPPSMTNFSINSQGIITVNLSDGSSFQRGQVMLQNFSDPQALSNVGNNLYSNMAAAGPLSAPVAPGSNGLGTIQAGATELSNVNLSDQMANLITAQRAFEANSKIVTSSDELLQDMVNLKR
ncbi:MAG TPA: flagellar hook-basal body complex protein [Verrucomicrobiae bacterium]|jgi:flagellar hook protein FlgE